MIRVLLTDPEYAVAQRALTVYEPGDQRDWVPLAKIKEKLGTASETKPVGFTNKEANVLMDALNEIDDEETINPLVEKLTGRAS